MDAIGQLDKAGPDLSQRVSIYPAQFLAGVVMVSLGPLLDSIMRDLGVPLSQGGLIAASYCVGQVLGILAINTLMARVPAKWILIGGAALQAVGLVAAGLGSWDLWSLFLAYIVVGFAWSLVNAIGWMWIPAHVKIRTASATLIMLMFFAAAMMITPIVLGTLTDAGAGWRWIFVGEGGLTLLMLVVFSIFPLLDIPGRKNVRLSHARQVAAFNPGLLAGMIAAGFFYTGAEVNLNVWLPKFQLDTFSTSDMWASLSVTLFWVGLLAGRFVGIRLAQTFFPSRLLLMCGATLAVFAIGLALAPNQAVALTLSVGAGLGASASYGLIGSYAGKFPGWQASVASSAFLIAGGVGAMIFPYLTGPIASSGGFRLAIGVTAVPAMIYALLSLVIHARSGERA